MQSSQLPLQKRLQTLIQDVKDIPCGKVADYIPELAQVCPEWVAMAVKLDESAPLVAGDVLDRLPTLQSVAKIPLLIAMLEYFGPDQVFQWVGMEPSEHGFASVARLDQFGPRPSNPLVNAGAIALVSHIPGNEADRNAWLDHAMQKLFGRQLFIDQAVFASETTFGDRNRALAYLLQSNRQIYGDIESKLRTYFRLCSYQADPSQVAELAYVLACGGMKGSHRLFSEETAEQVIALMTTCGLYNESGANLLHIGMPAKSGVSGYIMALALGHAGVAVYAPGLTDKGTSVRGAWLLARLSKDMGWHFARLACRQYQRDHRGEMNQLG